LIDRVSSNEIGYMLSDENRGNQNITFRTSLSGNINKYITSRYCPRAIISSSWNAYPQYSAPVKPFTGCNTSSATAAAATPNANGYYYYT
jgi:hypothetical protein